MTKSLLRNLLLFACRGAVMRNATLTLIYAAAFTLSLCLAYELRFDFEVSAKWDANRWLIWPVVILLKLALMFVFGQFDGLLFHFGTPDLRRIVAACGVSTALIVAMRAAHGVVFAPPLGVAFADFGLSVAILCTLRFTLRWARRHGFAPVVPAGKKPRRVAIVGAGECGVVLAKELLAKPWLALQPVAFFDDFRGKRSSAVGLPVAGSPDEIGDFKGELHLDEILIAMPSASAKRLGEVVTLCQEAGLPCRTLPALDQIALGHVSVNRLRPVEIQDLLGREPVVISMDAVRHLIAGRTVMVTGAGGSIGSELCRQCASFGPAKLLLVERSEPQLFAIEQELLATADRACVVPLIGDITREERMREIFNAHRPDVIFHAAAHKHVPMMEAQPGEAIRNNVFGSAQLIDLAVEMGVERFVLISTDKAVNPSSVMGATKRLAECYVQSRAAQTPATKLMGVRFGNVLGSSGSVVPIFTRQIAEGGPVTVTDPEMTRFFMTIPEAVTLVLQSAALGEGGEIFVLDMGQPVRILDLANQMIALSGLRPDVDIAIAFTGLRPGEKMHEELSHGAEEMTPTAHRKIRRLISTPRACDELQRALAELAAAVADAGAEPAKLRQALMRAVPDYRPAVKPPQKSVLSGFIPSANHVETRDAVGLTTNGH